MAPTPGRHEGESGLTRRRMNEIRQNFGTSSGLTIQSSIMESGCLMGSVGEFKEGVMRLSRKILRPGDWLVGIDDENEDDIIVIEKTFPDGYTYRMEDRQDVRVLDSRRSRDPYLKTCWESLPRVEELRFRVGSVIVPSSEGSFTPRIILAARPTGYTWSYLGSDECRRSEESSNPYYDGWMEQPCRP